MPDSEEDNLIVLDFSKARKDREFDSLLERMRKIPPLDIELDISEKIIRFSISGGGGGDPVKDRVCLILSELSGINSRSFASFRMNRSQWEDIKKDVDGCFEALARASARNKKEE